ncbi:hypothetical protein COR50_13070 [Chitinophaga caeni]|uniref:DinB-like domain-containing protein n=2 Tax=Chitinophaga caeni TaxID=2029983 RepID=A0A291QVX0_9BACT|nr:hypothetical protein COR50_13070 [Chitinophaga caeni]
MENNFYMFKQQFTYFEDALQDLENAIATFNDQNFNTKPAEGAWSAGQVVEHLIKSSDGLDALMINPVTKTQRDPLEKIPLIESVFLDFEAKYKAPEFNTPSEEPKDKTLLLHQILENYRNFRETYLQLPPGELCTGFEVPTMGTFTRAEWLAFVRCHTTRHTRQLRNIFNTV